MGSDVEGLGAQRGALFELLERAAAWMAGPGRRELAHMAREVFLERTGRVNEEDRSFETRMNAFMEFLVLERQEGRARTFLEEFAEAEGASLDRREQRLLGHLAAAHRSVFQLIRRKKSGLFLSDVLYGGQWELGDPQALAGVEEGDVIHATLVGLPEGVVVLPSVLHHPSKAALYALKVIREMRSRGLGSREISDRLCRMLLTHDRYPGMSLRQVYGV